MENYWVARMCVVIIEYYQFLTLICQSIHTHIPGSREIPSLQSVMLYNYEIYKYILNPHGDIMVAHAGCLLGIIVFLNDSYHCHQQQQCLALLCGHSPLQDGDIVLTAFILICHHVYRHLFVNMLQIIYAISVEICLFTLWHWDISSISLLPCWPLPVAQFIVYIFQFFL